MSQSNIQIYPVMYPKPNGIYYCEKNLTEPLDYYIPLCITNTAHNNEGMYCKILGKDPFNIVVDANYYFDGL